MAEQIGGDHYAAEYQHWDWSVDVRLGPLEYAATKYLSRWYKKNGLEDLKKPLSYMDKLYEVYTQDRWDNPSSHASNVLMIQSGAMSYFQIFVRSAGIPPVEADLCLKIASWKNDGDLTIIRGLLRSHIDAVTGAAEVARTTCPLWPLNTPQRQKTGGGGQAGGAAGQGAASSTSTGVGVNHPRPFGYDEDHPWS